MVEHLVEAQGVGGSIPSSSTIYNKEELTMSNKYEKVKYNHPDNTNVWFIDIKGNEPKWAVNIQPHCEKEESNDLD